MSQPFPTEDPKRPRAPWEEPFIGDDADASISYGEDVFMSGEIAEGETEQPSSSPQLPSADDAFPWQAGAGAANSRTTSSAPLPWEDRDTPAPSTYRDIADQSAYRSPTVPQTPSPPGPSKNLLQPKKLTSDIWQNVPSWGYVTAAAVVVLGVGVLWTANSIPKNLDAQPSALAGKNNTTATSTPPATSNSPIPVRPMRSRVSPGAPSGDSSKPGPGYVPEAAPADSPSTASPNNQKGTTAPETTSPQSPSESYMSPLASSSETGTAAGGPQNPFSPAYPKAPKPKPVVAPKPVAAPKPQPLPPPPKVLPAVLSLEGVATDGKTKFAIVRVGDQPLTAEVQVGAAIEGWTVAIITDETVTLTKGKQRQVLKLP